MARLTRNVEGKLLALASGAGFANMAVMRWIFAFWLAAFASLSAFELDSVVNPVVRVLPMPDLRPEIKGPQMAVSTQSEKASAHVKAGIVMLHSAWDFEAYRHFVAAAKEDPDCVMAYWGIVMSLAGSGNEFKEEMPAAMDRMLDLVEAGKGSELERGYAYAAAKLKTEGGRSAGAIFEGLSEKYPNDHLSKMWAAFFQRDGFDDVGNPRSGQLAAVEELRGLISKYPDDQSLIAFCLVAQAEMPDTEGKIAAEALPLARKIARLHPDFPPYQHLLGHYEFRSGNAKLAAQAFRDAATAYEKYMSANKLTFEDCPGWLRAKIYLAAALDSKGDKAEALPIYEEIAALKVSKERLYSPGGVLLLWDGRNMAARYLGGEDDAESLQSGLDFLSKVPAEQWHIEHSTAALYKDCLALYLGSRKAIIDGNLDAAKSLFKEFGKRGDHLTKLSEQERLSPSFSYWVRAIDTLAVLNVELEGLTALASEGATQKTALNWFRSADERQIRPSLLMPPALPNPMENRLGQYFLANDEAQKAASAYRAALVRVPNHLSSLEGYRLALQKLGRDSDAEKVAKRISLVKK